MRKLVLDDATAPAWIEKLPAIVDACVERWDLMPGRPFEDGYASLVLPVTRADGSEAVLKINIPDVESEQEHAALLHWDGCGAVRLLDHWPEQAALLIERCYPGEQLWSIEDDAEATRILAGVLRRIGKPAPTTHSFRLLKDEAQRWGAELATHDASRATYDRRILEAGIEAMLALGPNQGPCVVLHQDLHGGNILRAEREPWLIIDPKPLVGELEFDAGAFLRDRRELLAGSDGKQTVQRRLDILADELPIDRQRVRLWAIGHCIAWGHEDGDMSGEMLRAAELIWSCK